ncbi:E3 ubiquitin-protein ligase BRE1B [Trichinella pseudospiralis]|uniref:E3 ubiquitin protein ligase n=1 Tax=Trichinella pseudospiralis TaxID=6337 RepID=A0A0V0YC19_TRIPS|nr:E3 ubiquitin-protein ligase BRE1B [Trichinella pseudospiralis]KRY76588.1 E3 ubiquitin-protein ligase BRE1B [Trichinella pseudospiralis]KRZ38130.1 E3 ubiquitin-protein ligase BRE1B [Trichinella pseudospiralis]
MAKRSGVSFGSVNINDDGDTLVSKKRSRYMHIDVMPCLSSVNDVEIYLLKVQNKRLFGRVNQNRRIEDELRKKIDYLESHRMKDDALLSLLSGYLYQIQEELVMLLKHVSKTSSSNCHESINSIEAEESVLRLFPNMKKNIIDDRLREAFERCMNMIRQIGDINSCLDRKLDQVNSETKSNAFHSERTPPCSSSLSFSSEMRTAFDEANLSEKSNAFHEKCFHLQKCLEELEAKNRQLSLQNRVLQNEIALSENRLQQACVRVKDLEDETEKLLVREEQTNSRIAEVNAQLRQAAGKKSSVSKQLQQQASTSVIRNGPTDDGGRRGDSNVQRSFAENSEYEALAEQRLKEINTLTEQNKQSQRTIQMLRNKLENLDVDLVKQSPTYRDLEVQFKLHLRDSIRLKAIHESVMNEQAKVENNMSLTTEEQRTKKSPVVEQLEQSWQALKAEEEKLIAKQRRIEIDEEYLRMKLRTLDARMQQMPNIMSVAESKLQKAKHEQKLLKLKMSDVQAELNFTREELERLRRLLSSSVVVPLSNADDVESTLEKEESLEPGEIDESDEDDEKLRDKTVEEQVVELKKQLRLSKRAIARCHAAMDVYKTKSAENDDITVTTKKLRMENSFLRAHIRKMAKKIGVDRLEFIKLADDMLTKQEVEIALLKTKLENKEGNMSTLYDEIGTTGDALDQALSKNKTLADLISEKDNAMLKMMERQLATSQAMRSLEGEKKELAEMVRTLERQLQVQDADKEQLLKKLSFVESNLFRVVREGQRVNELIANHRNEYMELQSNLLTSTQNVKRLESSLETTRQDLTKQIELLENAQTEANRFRSTIGQLEKKLRRAYRGAENIKETTVVDLQIREEQIFALKQKVLCALCKLNQLNRVLLKCGHLFCDVCIDNLLKQRQRKCPNCMTIFSHQDVRNVYF